MANMFEVRCRGKMDCYNHFLVKGSEPSAYDTQINCEHCGSNRWDIRETDVTEREYFKRMLKDPHGTFGYHVIDEKLA